MKLIIPIEGIKAEVKLDSVVIQPAFPLRALSSSILNPSYSKFASIVNMQVPENCDHSVLRELFSEKLKSLGLSGRVLGLITAAKVSKVSIVSRQYNDLIVCAVVTAGILNPASAGDKALERERADTINIIVLVDGNLTQHCMVNSIMTATEAKSVALRNLDIRSRFSHEVATGTTSDMIAVACTRRGGPIMFAGTATKLGELIGDAVKEAVETAIKGQHGITRDRSLLKRLEERGIDFEQLLNTALELHGQHLSEESKKELKGILSRGLRNGLTNVNISALVLAGLRLQEDYDKGLIPQLLAKKREDSLQSLKDAGQVLGKCVANYMAGPRGVQTFLKFGKENRVMLPDVEPIASDIFKGLIAGLSPEPPCLRKLT